MDKDQSNCPQGPGPGNGLCQARIALGLSRQEVAQRLHLSLQQILALESDDYAHLPGPTYVRGYLRAYAQLVGLKPDTILVAYSTLVDGNKIHNLSSLAPKEEITSQHHHVKFATYAVAAILIGLALTWWQGRENGLDTPLPTPTTEPSVGAVYDSGMTPTDASIVPPALPSGALDATTIPASPPPIQSTNETILLHEPPAPKPASPPAAAINPGPNTEALGDVPGVRASLTLYADAESWMDVRDAQGNKLLYATVPAGRKIVLKGVVPLQVFLGNVAGVRAEFNGKPYDVNQHQRGFMARFSLGEELVQPPADVTDR